MQLNYFCTIAKGLPTAHTGLFAVLPEVTKMKLRNLPGTFNAAIRQNAKDFSFLRTNLSAFSLPIKANNHARAVAFFRRNKTMLFQLWTPDP